MPIHMIGFNDVYILYLDGTPVRCTLLIFASGVHWSNVKRSILLKDTMRHMVQELQSYNHMSNTLTPKPLTSTQRRGR